MAINFTKLSNGNVIADFGNNQIYSLPPNAVVQKSSDDPDKVIVHVANFSKFLIDFNDVTTPAVTSRDDLFTKLSTDFFFLANDGSGSIPSNPEFLGMKVGDISGGNYTEIEADGSTVARGSATVWDDIVGSLIASRLTSTTGRLNYNYSNNSITMQNAGSPDNIADRLMFNFQYPHSAVATDAGAGTQAAHYLHVHWEQTSSNRIEWQVDYRIQRNGQAKEETWTSVTANSVDDSVFPYVSGILNQITALAVVIIPEPSLSSTVEYRLTRIDTTTGDIEAVFVDAHVEKNTGGSRSEYAK